MKELTRNKYKCFRTKLGEGRCLNFFLMIAIIIGMIYIEIGVYEEDYEVICQDSVSYHKLYFEPYLDNNNTKKNNMIVKYKNETKVTNNIAVDGELIYCDEGVSWSDKLYTYSINNPPSGIWWDYENKTGLCIFKEIEIKCNVIPK